MKLKIIITILILLFLVTPVYADNDIEADYKLHEISALFSEMYPTQQMKAVHDYLIENIEYSFEYAYDLTDTRNLYGALVKGKATCRGYSYAYAEILKELGIDCRVMIGRTSYGSHAWNYIFYKRKGYFVDVTWDDTENGISYEWFMLKEIKNHYWKERYGTLAIKTITSTSTRN